MSLGQGTAPLFIQLSKENVLQSVTSELAKAMNGAAPLVEGALRVWLQGTSHTPLLEPMVMG